MNAAHHTAAESRLTRTAIPVDRPQAHGREASSGGAEGGTGSAPLTTDPVPLSILVLPFANQTGDERKAYIADAFTMSITADLARIRTRALDPVVCGMVGKQDTLNRAGGLA